MTTTDFNGFRGRAKKLEDVDLPRIAHRIGVGEDELHAFMDVESRGSGFDAQGRPRILFEPHVFYRNLSGTARTIAVGRGLAAKRWGSIAYGAEREQYGRLERAREIDETAALRACSWGYAQILGENHVMVGYATPQEMVRAFMDDEDNHIEAMVAFIVAAGIDDELRDLAALTRPTRPADCAPIVAVYNGPGYKKNRYHIKLAERHNWWRGIPDTPWEPGQDAEEDDAPLPPNVDGDAPPVDERPTADLRAFQIAMRARRYYRATVDGLDGVETRKALQRALAGLDYYDGAIDGVVGTRTRAAVRAFQRAHGLVADGVVGPQTRHALMQAVEGPVTVVDGDVPSLADNTSATREDDQPSVVTPEAVAAAGILAVLAGVTSIWWDHIVTWWSRLPF